MNSLRLSHFAAASCLGHGLEAALAAFHHAARTADGTPVILSVLPRLLESAQAQGLRTVPLRSTLPSAAS